MKKGRTAEMEAKTRPKAIKIKVADQRPTNQEAHCEKVSRAKMCAKKENQVWETKEETKEVTKETALERKLTRESRTPKAAVKASYAMTKMETRPLIKAVEIIEIGWTIH